MQVLSSFVFLDTTPLPLGAEQGHTELESGHAPTVSYGESRRTAASRWTAPPIRVARGRKPIRVVSLGLPVMRKRWYPLSRNLLLVVGDYGLAQIGNPHLFSELSAIVKIVTVLLYFGVDVNYDIV